MPSDLFRKWLQAAPSAHPTVTVYKERTGGRATALTALKKLLAEHFVGEEVILRAGGYAKSAEIIANSLPTNKRTRSGDLCELVATEHIRSETAFRIPINKLRWKSDRQMPMHGNDVVGVNAMASPIRVIKGECKSRVSFGSAVVKEAADGLDKHDGRPNPSTLAFIAKRLYEEDRDGEADVFRDLQCASAIAPKSITHMIFAMTGNDPTKHLADAPKPKQPGIIRSGVGIHIGDHGEFVRAVFEPNGA
jgi:hypothetical protein